jgi:predicted DNA-binding transcriptional regulator AlpA|tara:strand:- start:9966 stop:10325 length:360 start_codon:yes stop_codon:yes gene_type:complete
VNKSEHIKKGLIEALEQSLGIVTTACKKVGIGRTTFYKYLKEDDNFADQVKDIGNMSLDYVESKLFEQIKAGSTAATIFYLKTKGKKRGYVERQEITGADGVPSDVKIEIIENTDKNTN